uniref:Uncharacterized protein n=1 Tax=Rhabditophanes sp. KR3021 TaxID=114890 RepID=A0AC35U0W9_9BILA
MRMGKRLSKIKGVQRRHKEQIRSNFRRDKKKNQTISTEQPSSINAQEISVNEKKSKVYEKDVDTKRRRDYTPIREMDFENVSI